MSTQQSDVKPFFAGEVQLAGWTETHSAGCKVTLWLESGEDLDKFRHMTTKHGKMAGQRMYAVFVELGPQEEPVPPSLPTAAASAAPRGPLCMEAIGYCNNGEFMTWITRGTDYAATSAGAKLAMCKRLGIASRKELDADPAKVQAFKRLIQEYYRRDSFGGNHE